MKKRSSYRPRPVMADPLGYVLAGLKPVSTATAEMTVLGVKNHGAIEAVRTGTATRADVNHLVHMLNTATALAYMGQGRDWIPELAAAEAAVVSASKRSRFLSTGAELSVINLAIAVHDTQMADPSTTVQMLERAVDGMRKLERMGKTVRIRWEGAAA